MVNMWYIPILAILADQTTKHQDPLAELTRVVTFLQVQRQDLNWCESTAATMEGIEPYMAIMVSQGHIS